MNERTVTDERTISPEEMTGEQRPLSTSTLADAAQAERTRPAVRPEAAEEMQPLFPAEEAEEFQSRWSQIQTGFVDEPQQAVTRADELVATVIQRLAQVFAGERSTLESQWGQGDSGDTEALRMALRHYRSFFERLLAA